MNDYIDRKEVLNRINRVRRLNPDEYPEEFCRGYLAGIINAKIEIELCPAVSLDTLSEENT